MLYKVESELQFLIYEGYVASFFFLRQESESLSKSTDITTKPPVELTKSASATNASLTTQQLTDTDRPKSVSKISERAKKKAWYSVLYPSYKSRSEDFKKLFKDVPDDERLIVGKLFLKKYLHFLVFEIKLCGITFKSFEEQTLLT